MYAIRGGKDGFTGIVTSWATCESLVRGVSNAQYRKFPSEAAAGEWLLKIGGYRTDLPAAAPVTAAVAPDGAIDSTVTAAASPLDARSPPPQWRPHPSGTQTPLTSAPPVGVGVVAAAAPAPPARVPSAPSTQSRPAPPSATHTAAALTQPLDFLVSTALQAALHAVHVQVQHIVPRYTAEELAVATAVAATVVNRLNRANDAPTQLYAVHCDTFSGVDSDAAAARAAASPPQRHKRVATSDPPLSPAGKLHISALVRSPPRTPQPQKRAVPNDDSASDTGSDDEAMTPTQPTPSRVSVATIEGKPDAIDFTAMPALAHQDIEPKLLDGFYVLFFHGVCIPSANRSGAGFILVSPSGKIVCQRGQFVRANATAPEAELHAAFIGMKHAASLHLPKLCLVGCSEYVYTKLTQGIASPATAPNQTAEDVLCRRALAQYQRFPQCSIMHVYPEFNTEAFMLADRAAMTPAVPGK